GKLSEAPTPVTSVAQVSLESDQPSPPPAPPNIQNSPVVSPIATPVPISGEPAEARPSSPLEPPSAAPADTTLNLAKNSSASETPPVPAADTRIPNEETTKVVVIPSADATSVDPIVESWRNFLWNVERGGNKARIRMVRDFLLPLVGTEKGKPL